MAAPVERKVTVATTAAYLSSTAGLAVLTEVQDHHQLVDWMPGALAPFVFALIPTVLTFVSAYQARHTPRPLA